ncbi:MAG: hypothetical protein ABIF77_07610 [bacterium]
MNLSLSYNSNNIRETTSARGNISISTNLSKAWEFGYRGSYDFNTGVISNQSWNLNRDLHCWRLEFSRTIYGAGNEEFGLRIYLKSIPAVKLTRGKEDLMGSMGQFSGGIF